MSTRSGTAQEPVEGRLTQWIRGARAALSIFLYALIAPWGYALFAVLVFLPSRHPLKRRDRLQACMRLGFRTLHRWMAVCRIAEVSLPPEGERSLPEPCVVIANHPTHLDITAILSWVPRCCTLVKPSIYRRWWLKPLMEGSGQIEGAGAHPLEGARLVERAADRLRAGQSVVVFPEGTRTEPGRRMPFHRLGFEIACRTGVPVVPLRIRCEPRYLSKGRPTLVPPSPMPKLSVEILDPLRPEVFGGDSRRLREHARSLYFSGATRAARIDSDRGTSRTTT